LIVNHVTAADATKGFNMMRVDAGVDNKFIA
jgi:hypothetical protein